MKPDDLKPSRPVPAFPTAVLDLLDRPVWAHMSTSGPKGQPQASVIWFERRGIDAVLFAGRDAVKTKNLQRSPRVVLIIIDPETPEYPGVPAYVRLAGAAQILAPEPGIQDRLARRYGHPDGYPFSRKPYVTIRIAVERISGYGGRYGDEALSRWRREPRDNGGS